MAEERTALRIGGPADVAWITEATPGLSVPPYGWLTIQTAIPAVFAAYATVLIPDGEEPKKGQDRRLVDLLRGHTAPGPWWLGFLETGVADLVFPAAPRTLLYPHWPYVLAQAGPDQALAWRSGGGAQITPWHSGLPELMFPDDHSWLVSTMWDDDWRCVGGPQALIDTLVGDPVLETRVVVPGEDATPPGHEAR